MDNNATNEEKSNILVPERLNTVKNYYHDLVVDRHIQNLILTYGSDTVRKVFESVFTVQVEKVG